MPFSMELDDAKDIQVKFSELADEVTAVLDRIKQREAKEELRRKRECYSAPRPRNIYKQLPGRSDFEYIKVPKQPPVLSFGSKCDRTVFPNIPGIITKDEEVTKSSSKQITKEVKYDSTDN